MSMPDRFAAAFTIQDDPPEAFIEELRRRYPTDPEVDRALTLKMRNRGGPPYQRIQLDDLEERLTRFLESRLDHPFSITDTHWFTGGVSKIQIGFVLHWTDPATQTQRVDRMVLRMDPSEGSNATSRSREFALLQLAKDLIPVPEVFWLEPDGDYFPRPAFIYAYATGVTKPSMTTTGKVSGIGTNFGARYRELLAPQYMRHLAALHSATVPDEPVGGLHRPGVGTSEAAELLLNQARRTWEEDRAEDIPLMEVAANWLQDNLPDLDRISIVHGDFRSGNFLFDEESGNITAWLDWERGHLGDRHRDLAWLTQKTFGHVGDDGRFYVVGLVAEDEFYDWYKDLAHLTVDQEWLDFYRLLNNYTMVVSALASTYRIARLGKSHQDIVLTRVKGVVPTVLGNMRDLLRERI